MIFVFVYLILSIVFYVKLFESFKTYSSHPEMKKVKRGEPLLGVKFRGTPSSHSDKQSADLGFAQFLADHPPNDRDHDGT